MTEAKYDTIPGTDRLTPSEIVSLQEDLRRRVADGKARRGRGRLRQIRQPC